MSQIVTPTTDFWASSPYVAATNGMLLALAPQARIVALCHSVEPENVRGDGARNRCFLVRREAARVSCRGQVIVGWVNTYADRSPGAQSRYMALAGVWKLRSSTATPGGR